MESQTSPSERQRGRSPVSRVTYALALIGALTLLAAIPGFALKVAFRGSPTGIVLGPDGKPLAKVPIFLDRGGAAIERYTTDSAGAFSFALRDEELGPAVWLICARGAVPAVGRRSGNALGPTTYGYTALPDSTFGFYRASGWRGPIPRECPRGTDAMGWRYPPGSGKGPDAFTRIEPEWPD